MMEVGVNESLLTGLNEPVRLQLVELARQRDVTVKTLVEVALREFAENATRRNHTLLDREVRSDCSSRSDSWQAFARPLLSTANASDAEFVLECTEDLMFADWPEDDEVDAFLARAKGRATATT